LISSNGKEAVFVGNLREKSHNTVCKRANATKTRGTRSWTSRTVVASSCLYTTKEMVRYIPWCAKYLYVNVVNELNNTVSPNISTVNARTLRERPCQQ